VEFLSLLFVQPLVSIVGGETAIDVGSVDEHHRRGYLFAVVVVTVGVVVVIITVIAAIDSAEIEPPAGGVFFHRHNHRKLSRNKSLPMVVVSFSS